jgi:FAD:protein FMN transferase
MDRKIFSKTALYMDTRVSITIVSSSLSEDEAYRSIYTAFEAFHFIETLCSRFNEESEVMQLSRKVQVPVPVNPVLFEAVRFSYEIANLTDGAFDPTIGKVMEEQGFNCHYLTGQRIQSGNESAEPVSYRDIVLDEEKKTIYLKKPIVIDLGAVAKGLAIDLASKALASFDGFFINAGGDLFVGGTNQQGEQWKIGIQHPLERDKMICSLQLSDVAVCTSGSYERKSPIHSDSHHLINPKTKKPQAELLSCTVIAPFAMMADTFSTAAFILGQEAGIQQLEEVVLEGILISSSLELHMTKNMERYVV